MRADLLAVLALAASPAIGHAGNGVPVRARELASAGRAAHDRGDYAGAIAAFTEAYELAPSAPLLFNLAQAYRLQGNCEHAAALYRRYLDDPAAREARALAQTQLAAAERCARPLTAPVGDATDFRRVSVPQGDLDPGEPPPPPRSSRGHLRDAGLVSIAGGGAVLAVAGYFALRAHEAADDVEHAYAVGGAGEDVVRRDREGRHAARAARILGAGGGLALVTGVTLAIVGTRAERVAPLAVTPSSTTAQVSYTWRF